MRDPERDRSKTELGGPISAGPPLVPGVRRDCTYRVLPAKLGVAVHYLSHQLFDHMLANDPILLARQFCDRLRDRINDSIGFRVIDFG